VHLRTVGIDARQKAHLDMVRFVNGLVVFQPNDHRRGGVCVQCTIHVHAVAGCIAIVTSVRMECYGRDEI
jgi:hypothetical protein